MGNLDENLVMIATIYGGVILAAFWLTMIIWSYRDMRARSRDTLARMLVALIVAILNVPGIFIYIMLRPRETLSEAYERSLEEEALLQEIEEKPTCPGCSHRVDAEWQACPYCHTRLKKPCISCNKMLELSWNLCPHCATSQVSDHVITASRHVRQHQIQDPPTIPDKWLSQSETGGPSQQAKSPSIEFIEGEDY